MLDPDKMRRLTATLKLHERGVLLAREAVDRLHEIAHPDDLDAVLAAIPPGWVEPLRSRHSRGNVTATLPPITSVDAVPLRDISPDHVDQYMSEARGIVGVTIGGEAAQTIASLWRQLPPGGQARCHTPPYGLRFRSAGAIVLQASICWGCNNIFGDFDGGDFHCEFDGKSIISIQLLELIRQALGDGPNG